MSPIIKQTIKNKNISFWKILLMIVMTVIIVNTVIGFFAKFGSTIASIAALLSLVMCTVICGMIIYKNLAYYNYRVIDDELMVERVIGRTNHIFFHINIKDIKYIKPYREADLKNDNEKIHKFVIGSNKADWYIIEFQREDKIYRLIIEPNETFLEDIKQNIKKTEDKGIGS